MALLRTGANSSDGPRMFQRLRGFDGGDQIVEVRRECTGVVDAIDKFTSLCQQVRQSSVDALQGSDDATIVVMEYLTAGRDQFKA